MNALLYASILAVTILMLLPSHAQSTPACLAKNGIAKAVIVVANDATLAEQFAAKELQVYLHRVTSADFKIVSSSSNQNTARILVGLSTEVKRLLPDVKWNKLGNDGIVIRTVGNTLILAGGRPRGTLYAVYTFLEDYIGCRWWTKDSSFIPAKKNLMLGNINKVYVPKFFYRSVHSVRMYYETGHFGAMLKLNGEVPALPVSMGGYVRIKPFVHTFYELLPPAKYFASHPEWYGESGGSRAHEGRQLCLSNPEMRAELVKNALALIASDPSAGIISISQNDGAGPCQCSECLAQDKKFGGPSGTIINFVNLCAEEIEKTCPDYKIETLAYTYSRTAPTSSIKARRNVIVRLCSIECDFATPLDSTRNKGYFHDLKAWGKVTSNLFIWDYVWNYHQQLIPHPNWQVLGPNLRIFAANKVVGIFEQDDRFNPTINFTLLRTWLLAHLLWDPSLDQDKLMNEFLTGYYGSAGKYLKEYLDYIGKAAIKNTVYMPCWNDDPCFLTSTELKHCVALFDKAQKAVKSNPVLSERLKIERIALNHLVLLNRRSNPEVKKWITDQQAADMAKIFMEQCKATENIWLGEGIRIPDNYEEILSGRLYVTYNGLPIPPMKDSITVPDIVITAKIPKEQWIDLQEPRFNVIAPDTVVSDSEASNGVAVKMHSTDAGVWSPQAQLISSDCRLGIVKLYVRLKMEAGQAAGGTYEIGVYDGVTKSYLLRRYIALDELKPGGYHEYEIGSFTPNASSQIYLVSPRTSEEQRTLYLDRLILVKSDK
jgi:hypothetical protein